MKVLLFLFTSLLLSFPLLRFSTQPTEDIRKFYFPYTELTTPKVYHYSNLDNKEENRYLHLRSYQVGDSYFLISTTFDSYCSKRQKVTRKITSLGTYIVEYNVYHPNKEGKKILIPCLIEKSDTLHWNCIPGEKVGWKVSYPILGQPNCRQVFIKNREYLTQTEVKVYQGKGYRTCRFFDSFELKEICSSIVDKWTPGSYYRENYFYAEGIGLVEYQQTNAIGIRKTLTLTNIMDEQGWNKYCLEMPRR